MKAPGKATVHKIGWVRATQRYPAEPQIEALKAYGVKLAIFTAGEDTIGDALHTLRNGDEFVVHGLSRIAETRAEVRAVLEIVRKKQGLVYDAATSEYVTGAGIEAVLLMIEEQNGERRMPTSEIARERGKLGGGKPGRMRVKTADAKRIWHDDRLTMHEAADQIGLAWRTCYRRFGDRGLPAGRRKPRQD